MLKPIKSDSCHVPKGWGFETIIINNENYCGKLLVFNSGAKFSMHYHLLKEETWYVQKGSFLFRWIETETGILNTSELKINDILTIPRGLPHQLEALEDSVIFEISTKHFDSDSYRIYKGD